MNNSLFLFFVFLFLSLSLFISQNVVKASINAELVQKGVLTVCAYDAFEPVVYGNGLGYESDLLRAVAKKMGLQIRFLPISRFEGLWLRPVDKNPHCDLAAGGLSITKSRILDGAGFTAPHFKILQSLLVRKEDYEKGLKDYANFKEGKNVIGVVPGSTGKDFAIERAIEAHLNVAKTIKDYPSEVELLLALQKGEISAIARGTPGNFFQAAKNGQWVVTALRDFGEEFAFAVNPAKKELLRGLNSNIKRITQQGKIGLQEWLKNNKVFN